MKPLRHFATSPLRHFATSPLRHASRLVALIGLALACATANAALIVNVEGVRGSGKTTWTLSGSSTTAAGTIGTSTNNANNRRGGYMQFSNGVKFLSTTGRTNLRSSINSPLAVTGSPKLTIGSEERDITHLTLSPFFGFTGADGDVLWFRVNRDLSYVRSSNSSWSGSFTLDVDISNFKIGTYTENDPGNSFFASDLTLIFKETTKTTPKPPTTPDPSTPKPPTTVKPTSVPEPSSLALLGLALAGLRFSRKLKGAQSRA